MKKIQMKTKTKNKVGRACMIIGAVLVVTALSLFIYNRWDAARADKAAASALEKVESELTGEKKNSEIYASTEEVMSVVTIDGYDYIGYLSIPSIELTLPVMSEWSYPGLKIAPGRYSGSVYTNNMVIAGHNYARHFSPIKYLDEGTEVNFTDMDNQEWHYRVIEVETLEATAIEDMTQKIVGNDWDLTLFTCTTDGQSRCAVRCERIMD